MYFYVPGVSIHAECINRHNPLLMNSSTYDSFHMGRFKESKYFLPMEKYSKNCLWLTIGIGGDDLVEKEFKQKYPQCQVYGVEPSNDQYATFEKCN